MAERKRGVFASSWLQAFRPPSVKSPSVRSFRCARCKSCTRLRGGGRVFQAYCKVPKPSESGVPKHKTIRDRVRPRATAAKALVQWRQDLIKDLGGDVSTQEDAIVSLAVKTKLLLDSIDVWLLQQPTLIIKKKRAIIPAVAQRQTLADALARYMSMLGLERKSKLTSLSEILARDDKPYVQRWDSRFDFSWNRN